eukprot:gb/GFBE01074492.1/.p1 GENE.gb/GFBE01074492.1/~~gb/GFBE01074492.1/.p1  ORF type:complete len:1232 (+),score=158.31 gb/GFBE01074492.1/:1-3696(+)
MSLYTPVDDPGEHPPDDSVQPKGGSGQRVWPRGLMYLGVLIFGALILCLSRYDFAPNSLSRKHVRAPLEYVPEGYGHPGHVPGRKKTEEPELRALDDGILGVPQVAFIPEANTASSQSDEFLVALGSSSMPSSRTDCWAPCHGKPGWCSWCGHGRACCRLGSKFDPKECRGFGGQFQHECVRIPAQASAQCGGHLWNGATSCVPGYSCVRLHHGYSECMLADSSKHECAEPYGTCGGWHENAPWQKCCTDGHTCTDISTNMGQTATCLPENLLHVGKNCFDHCNHVTGDCEWCGGGNACCARGDAHGPLECQGVRFSGFEAYQCVVPTKEVAVKHHGQSCLEYCGGAAGMCTWCGEGNACCRKGSRNDPSECHGVHAFSASDHYVCVQPAHSIAQQHRGQDCWEPCNKKSGYCGWCGESMACCRKGAQNDPFECFGVTEFSRDDRHVCVEPVSLAVATRAQSPQLMQTVQPKHPGKDCWYACEGSGFCSWCGEGNACCREGARFDKEECNAATQFSSAAHHVCVVVPTAINKVHITSTKPYRVLFNGNELGPGGKIRGVAGTGTHAAEARDAGVDAIRTWSMQQSVGALQVAGRHGVKVAAGIYITTFKDKYEGKFCELDNPWWEEQLRAIIANVTAYRNDPALLWWQVGNELELQTDWAGGNECMWRRLEWVVKHVKAADPNHPVGTAIAGFHKLKVERINMLAPSLDFIGLNVYGGDAFHIPQKLASAGWTRPYAVTEYGAAGAWMVPQTPWGASVEPTSTQKAMAVRQVHEECLAQDSCLGDFTFMWGWKWENTPTWFSTFNEWQAAGADEPATDLVHAMQESWTGTLPANPAPKITAVSVSDQHGQQPAVLGLSVQHGAVFRVEVSAIDLPRDDAQSWEDNDVIWVVTEDKPGQMSAKSAVVPDIVSACTGDSPRSKLVALVDTSKLKDGKAYRLYAFVRDNVAQNLQSLDQPICCATCQDLSEKNKNQFPECSKAMDFAFQHGLTEHPDWYSGLSPSSSITDLQQLLQSRGGLDCPRPCAQRCRSPKDGDACDETVRWTMTEGTNLHPEWYPGLTPASSYREVQSWLFEHKDICPPPCAKQMNVTEAQTSIPFKLCHDASQHDSCGQEIGRVMMDMHRHPERYPHLKPTSGFRDVQFHLYNQSMADCQAPCDECTDAGQDTVCARTIWKQMFHMREPLTAPFSGTSMWSSYPELQSVLRRYNKGQCPQPCALTVPAAVQMHCPAPR